MLVGNFIVTLLKYGEKWHFKHNMHGRGSGNRKSWNEKEREQYHFSGVSDMIDIRVLILVMYFSGIVVALDGDLKLQIHV